MSDKIKRKKNIGKCYRFTSLLKCGRFQCGNSVFLYTCFYLSLLCVCHSAPICLVSSSSPLYAYVFFLFCTEHFIAIQKCDVCRLNWLLMEMHSAQLHINNDFVSWTRKSTNKCDKLNSFTSHFRVYLFWCRTTRPTARSIHANEMKMKINIYAWRHISSVDKRAARTTR